MSPQSTASSASAKASGGANTRNFALIAIAAVAILTAGVLIFLGTRGSGTYTTPPELMALTPKLDAIVKSGKYPELSFSNEGLERGIVVHGAMKTKAQFDALKAEVMAAVGNIPVTWDVAYPQQ